MTRHTCTSLCCIICIVNVPSHCTKCPVRILVQHLTHLVKQRHLHFQFRCCLRRAVRFTAGKHSASFDSNTAVGLHDWALSRASLAPSPLVEYSWEIICACATKRVVAQQWWRSESPLEMISSTVGAYWQLATWTTTFKFMSRLNFEHIFETWFTRSQAPGCHCYLM